MIMNKLIKNYFLLKMINNKYNEFYKRVLYLFFIQHSKFRIFNENIDKGMTVKYALEKAEKK